ncbi:MAG: pyruvate, phosphate dikinase [Deltaproteobacteria bacterium]|nr:pyruvate, phosphate dikinase [Deltaproteobacteria bacterium]
MSPSISKKKTNHKSAAAKSEAARSAPARKGAATPSKKATTSAKRVFFFGDGRADGNATMKNLLGGKGANLAEMAGIGLPVPPGFTITTEVCAAYDAKTGSYPKGLDGEVSAALARLEKAMGKRFGDAANPLLVSVRSGARASMPGMMDTVLNLGLNDKTVEGLAKASGNERFAWDSYRRFVQMYGDVVMGLKPESAKETDPFEAIIEKKKEKLRIHLDTELTAEHLKELVAEFKAAVRKHAGRPFPTDPNEQLWGAIGAVFRSWTNERANVYRKLNNIPESWGTAVNVQAMVFGNSGSDSATGVAFTRDPSTGEKRFFGEFLVNAQGEDVVAGTRTPQQILKVSSQAWARENEINEKTRAARFPSLEEVMPECSKQLLKAAATLENHYRDMQDLEFTIENGRLWMLQTRNGKRTATSAVRIAVEMEKEGLIDRNTAVLRVAPEQIDQLLHPTIDAKAPKTLFAKGLGASPGAASGRVVFSAEDAVAANANGDKVILVRIETSPEDIAGMDASLGILTAKGGRTSHAAVVARGMGKCCVVGCEVLRVDYKAEHMTANGKTIKAGEWITMDGATGAVYVGQVPTNAAKLSGDFAKLMKWADQARRLHVRTNADTPHDAEVARAFGAEGIGLCRTEHMFFLGDRIDAVREMILATTLEARETALAKLLPYQRKDFAGIFKAMNGLPVTIRLLDPPLHEFLPHTDAEYADLAQKTGIKKSTLEQTGAALHEFNPMLGHRGCRLAITYPEIYAMQTRAIIEAALEVAAKGVKVHPEIMIPLVATARELATLRKLVTDTADAVLAKKKKKLSYTVGTMIEVPRAAITADEIAGCADFFSFGTNDLTQMGFGLSRDDAGRFLPEYVNRGVIDDDPFVTIDQGGVGLLIKIAAEKGRSIKPGLKLGICGEHGGDPRSVAFCHKIGLDYVSCSPYRVPVARLAAAHAALAK